MRCQNSTLPASSVGRTQTGWLTRRARRYWHFLLYVFIGLTVCELTIAPFHGLYPLYSAMIGYVGLSIEATLPLPQILANARARSCKGFRLSVLVSWLLGDTMKMFWFFTATSEIPWAFKLCGIFQAGCDIFLGIQYFMYGSGEAPPTKEHQMASWGGGKLPPLNKATSALVSGRGSPTGRRTPNEKDT